MGAGNFFSTFYDPMGIGYGDAMFGVGGDDGGGGGFGDYWNQYVAPYIYDPKYTSQTELGLFDLFEQLTGRRGGVEQLPFDIGLPTTGLYDALTRGIREDYLGTPGGPEGGRIADTRAYYNNLGIPEQAINQERLANQDLNNLLGDQAALINESQKDRLTGIVGMGLNTGSNLYGQNLAQHRANAGLGMQASLGDMNLQESIRQANQQSLNSLMGGIGSVAGPLIGYSLGGPAGAAAGGTLTSLINQKPQVSRGGYYNGNVPSLFGSAGTPYSQRSSEAKLLG